MLQIKCDNEDCQKLDRSITAIQIVMRDKKPAFKLPDGWSNNSGSYCCPQCTISEIQDAVASRYTPKEMSDYDKGFTDALGKTLDIFCYETDGYVCLPQADQP